MNGYLFLITGVASPDLPLRLLNLFAQQDLAFDRVMIARQADRYVVSVEHPGLPQAKASIIAEKMKTMVLVDSVEVRIAPAGHADAAANLNETAPEIVKSDQHP